MGMSFGWAGMGVIVIDEAHADPNIAFDLLNNQGDGFDSTSNRLRERSMCDDHAAWCKRTIDKYNLQHCAGWPGMGVINAVEHAAQDSRKSSKESVGSAVSTQPPSEEM